MGSLSVLNTGKGDLHFNFDVDNQNEVDQAKVVIQDMLARGYALLVEVDGEFHRVQEFDPERGTYKIVMVPHRKRRETEVEALPSPPKKRGKHQKKEVPMTKARAVGVGPTAGG